jgi:transposase
VTNEQWAIIGPLVMKPRQGPGRPVRLNLRLVVNAILYVLRTGCQWAYLPREYPNFNSVYDHFHSAARGRINE